ncbi:MAG: prolyl oligopeptidase family serine peptidase [Phycisphaerales bacterium]|nr:prolyl oligopeptidase family serine peptidase [Phycisphaerales bacterium]
MPDLSSSLPSALRVQARYLRLGGVPALVAHPDWSHSAPVVVWMHGRTVNKELDPGRYLRWIRSGIAACALDLPGHGERLDESMLAPTRTLDVVEQMVGEIDGVIADLCAMPEARCFDMQRLAIGGMSAGGMATLRRLCDPHPFVAACVEATCGDFARLYDPAGGSNRPWESGHAAERIAGLDPARRLEGFRPVPVLALHSEADQWVPWDAQRGFLAALREHYRRAGADPGLVEIKTWTETGAPFEHAGFGRFGPEAKTVQTEFLSRALDARPRGAFGG